MSIPQAELISLKVIRSYKATHPTATFSETLVIYNQKRLTSKAKQKVTKF